ncbi:FixH family protein [Lutibacter citreus]|uniref:FixH family protein n=1 Tax=Lutibacter citreus TaxID=2138210 RepID=UPI000DBE227E|nr:FixH family protein [Lutibacter citreus]
MKLRITWPAAIIFSIVAFMVFILSFVYKVTFLPEYDHHLVSEEYYKDELNYQKEIDMQTKGLDLKENVSIKKTKEGLLIIFPKEFEPNDITGEIYFKRLSNDKIDFKLPIELNSKEFLIKKEDLLEGRWDVIIEWTANKNTYLFKEKLMY